MMKTAGDHRGHGCPTAGAHKCPGVTCRRSRNKEAEAQNGIQRGLDPESDPNGDDVPTVRLKQAICRIPALCPGEQAEINTRDKDCTQQKSTNRNEITPWHLAPFQ